MVDSLRGDVEASGDLVVREVLGQTCRDSSFALREARGIRLRGRRVDFGKVRTPSASSFSTVRVTRGRAPSSSNRVNARRSASSSPRPLRPRRPRRMGIDAQPRGRPRRRFPIDHQPIRRRGQSLITRSPSTSTTTTPAPPKPLGSTLRKEGESLARFARRPVEVAASHAASARAVAGTREQRVAVLARRDGSASSSIEAAPGVPRRTPTRPTTMSGSIRCHTVLSPLPSTEVAVSRASSNRPAATSPVLTVPKATGGRSETAVVHEAQGRFCVHEHLARLTMRDVVLDEVVPRPRQWVLETGRISSTAARLQPPTPAGSPAVARSAPHRDEEMDTRLLIALLLGELEA